MRLGLEAFRPAAERGARARVCALASLLAVAVVVGVPVALGSAQRSHSLDAPTGLDTFPLRPGPATSDVFWQTPSFKWQGVRGAAAYGFELATRPSFRDSELVWSTGAAATPALALPLSLPWLPQDARLYWRVRVTAGNGTSAWSEPAAFGLTWDRVPEALPSVGGYARWSSVRGASGYDVWLVDKHKVLSTTTTFADFREYHGGTAPQNVRWRVRAVRRLYGPAQHGALPAVSRGPWSETYSTPTAGASSGSLRTIPGGPGLMPGFVFPVSDPAQLSHVYVTTDPACTHVVFNSALVRGGAFAPRAIQLTENLQGRFPADAGTVYRSNGRSLVASEAVANPAAGEWARIDLPDGAYYWTVVGTERQPDGSYRDTQSPRTACRSARGILTVASAAPSLGTHQAPYAAGLSPRGRLLSAAATKSFYGRPVVSWKWTPGATQYQLQWSRSPVAWNKAVALTTYATSAVLPLTPGTWWYRVRALDAESIGEQARAWSAPAKLRITPPVYRIAQG